MILSKFRIFILVSLAFFASFRTFAEVEMTTEDADLQSNSESDHEVDGEKSVLFDIERNSFFITVGPMIMVNTDSKTKSAPSPVMYAIGVGGDLFQDRKVCFNARFSFFANYYLWDGDKGQPAEIENRTATGLSFMLDALGGHSWRLGFNELTLAGGLGVLIRFAVLSNGVDGNSASEDVSAINSWFYSKMNFLYPQISFSYMRSAPDFLGRTKFGGEFRTYFSMGEIVSGNFFDGMMFSFAAKVRF